MKRRGSEYRATEETRLCAGIKPQKSVYMCGVLLHEYMGEGWTVHMHGKAVQDLPRISCYGIEIETNIIEVEEL